MSRVELTQMLNLANAALKRADKAALIDGAPTGELADLLVAATRVLAFQAELLAVAAQRLSQLELAHLYQVIRDARAEAQAAANLAGTPAEGTA